MTNTAPSAGKRKIVKLITVAGGQLQLSNLSGISQTMICRYNKGQFDSITVRAYLRLAKAAKALGVPIKPEDFV